MSEQSSERPTPEHHSASAEAAAIRWSETHPDEDVDVEHPPAARTPESEEHDPERPSASAESAALRWRQEHPDDQER